MRGGGKESQEWGGGRINFINIFRVKNIVCFNFDIFIVNIDSFFLKFPTCDYALNMQSLEFYCGGGTPLSMDLGYLFLGGRGCRCSSKCTRLSYLGEKRLIQHSLCPFVITVSSLNEYRYFCLSTLGL